MSKRQKSIAILMADDDPDDRQLTQHAFERSRWEGDLQFVEDGEELMDYLKRRGKYYNPATSPRPIGRETLNPVQQRIVATLAGQVQVQQDQTGFNLVEPLPERSGL